MIRVDFNKNTQEGVLSGEYFTEIREHFSIPNPNKRHSRFAKARLYAITPGGKFDIGWWDEIEKYINDKQFPTDVSVSSELLSAFKPTKFSGELIENLTLPLRYYQKDTCEMCIEHGRGTVLLATGAGKTLTIATLIENYYQNSQNKETFKCLIIVPDIGLVEQTYKDFLEYKPNFTFCRWSGKNDYDLAANCIIVNNQLLCRRINDTPWINFVDLLVVDEIHKLGNDNKLSKIVSKIKTFNKYGFTGTLPKDQQDIWNIIGLIGKVLIEKKSHELRDEKFLSEVTVKMLNIEYKDKPLLPVSINNTTDYYRNELEFLCYNVFRNKLLKTICTNFGENILILVNRREHGEFLYNQLVSNLDGKQVYYIHGDVEVDDRERIKELMGRSNNVVCIAMSAVFSVGINVKNIHMIIFAAGGKAFIRIVQSIGRGLRLHERKKLLRIIDFFDNLRYSGEHGRKRMSIYDEEKIQYTISYIKE